MIEVERHSAGRSYVFYAGEPHFGVGGRIEIPDSMIGEFAQRVNEINLSVAKARLERIRRAKEAVEVT